ncbi:hypothetical protein R6Q59_009485 [Mikania micrantha]
MDLYELGKEKETISNEIERKSENYVFTNENENGFIGELMINQDHIKQIAKAKLKLETNQVFKQTLFKSIKSTFNRKKKKFFLLNFFSISNITPDYLANLLEIR